MLLKAERKFGPDFEDDSEEEQATKQELEELAAQANVKIEEDTTKKQVRKSSREPGSPTRPGTDNFLDCRGSLFL